MAAAEGNIAAMFESALRQDYYASMSTGFMNTTGTCIELFYWLTYSADQPILAVITSDEELTETVSWEGTEPVLSGWNRAFVKLPDGINTVRIQGLRSENGIGCR